MFGRSPQLGRHCHPERSEGSCRAEFELRMSRSLAALGMTVTAASAFPSFPPSVLPSFRLSAYPPSPYLNISRLTSPAAWMTCPGYRWQFGVLALVTQPL
jgi:hypothetical protein